jgi:FeS assembly protein IscX
MRLSWSNQTDIAAALIGAYPDVDRLSLDHDHLLQLIRSLPAFNDTPVPPRSTCLDNVLWTWMRLADSDSETGERRCQ